MIERQKETRLEVCLQLVKRQRLDLRLRQKSVNKDSLHPKEVQLSRLNIKVVTRKKLQKETTVIAKNSMTAPAQSPLVIFQFYAKNGLIILLHTSQI